MRRALVVVLFVPFVLFAAACSSGSKGPTFGSGGAAAGGAVTGGSSGSGGAVSAGGAATGGADTNGGAAGGSVAVGGAAGNAGSGGRSSATGGTTGNGGATGGATATGGVIATGGVLGSGGAIRDAAADRPASDASDAGRDTSREQSSNDALTSDGAPCPANGHITYTVNKAASPTADQQQAYNLITTAMDKAVYYYNCYTNIAKAISVSYDPSVPTADGNSNGSIRFGGTQYIEYTRAMHEISHTVGVGTASNWRSFIAFPDGGSNGPWTGANATAELRAITGVATDTLTADTQHFWPYGLNYVTEVKSEADVIDHCRIVVALRKDLGMQ